VPFFAQKKCMALHFFKKNKCSAIFCEKKMYDTTFLKKNKCSAKNCRDL